MIHFAIYPTSIGFLRIERRGRSVVGLHILSQEPCDRGVADDFLDQVAEQVMQYLRGERKSFDVDLDISGCTPFQQRVLSELQRIPYGETRTYKQIATAVGNPKASRAVGMANNRNPIGIIIPCHRVVGSNGDLVGYASGVERKRFLLDLERG